MVTCICQWFGVVVNALVSINDVALHRARLLQGGPKKWHKVYGTIILQPYITESCGFCGFLDHPVLGWVTASACKQTIKLTQPFIAPATSLLEQREGRACSPVSGGRQH